MFANEGRNMLRDTTDRPLSTIKVIRAGGAAAFPGMVSSSQSGRPGRKLLKKKPPNLSGGHGLPPTTDIARFLRWFGALPIRTTATSENCGQQGVVLNRGRSRVLRFQSVVGSGVIALQRSNSAHLHRPWCATSLSWRLRCAAI